MSKDKGDIVDLFDKLLVYVIWRRGDLDTQLFYFHVNYDLIII